MHTNIYPANKHEAERIIKENKIVLVLTPLRFYTNDDEDLFFEWIKKIKCIEGCRGVGKDLYLIGNSNTTISYNDFSNFLGLFRRYKLKNINQIKIFINDKNREWFEGL